MRLLKPQLGASRKLYVTVWDSIEGRRRKKKKGKKMEDG